MTQPVHRAPAARYQPGERVGPIRAVGNFFRKVTQFSGRASRSEYWWVVLVTFLLTLGWDTLKSRTGIDVVHMLDQGPMPVTVVVVVLYLAIVGFLIVANISLQVRRLHDANLSGWLFLLALVPVLGTITLLILSALAPHPAGARFDAAPRGGAPR